MKRQQGKEDVDEKCKKQEEENKKLSNKAKVLEEEIKLLRKELDKKNGKGLEMGRKTRHTTDEILRVLDGDREGNIDNLMEIIQEKCPENIYKAIKTEKGSIMNAKGFDAVLPLGMEANFDSGLNRKVREKYEKVEIMKKINRKPGDVTFIERRMGIPEGSEVTYKSSYLFIITTGENKDQKESRNELHKTLCRVRDKMHSMGRKYIAYPLFDKENEQETRNILEYVFRESDSQLTFNIVKNETTGEKHKKKPRSRKNNDNMVVIKVGGKHMQTY